MGVCRLFSRGGQNFPGGWQKHTIGLKNALKNTSFIQKSQKTILAGQGGQVPPLALPCGRPCLYAHLNNFDVKDNVN